MTLKEVNVLFSLEIDIEECRDKSVFTICNLFLSTSAQRKKKEKKGIDA